ncbi:MAG: hypothetical protein CVV64_00025 [Candidatus Wallbacteria bacterium HGW-Wallbacteria-1]|jgi:Na+-transporting NADH:ubiquinone oxidoreductase subunit NqrD|uniref:NADH:ubiquinone reductase (Na(+)-transporting) subunit D n=1 Tax=Candidatus Wallbacteria bacterium HGW-Wallbacteria-1 TaxID=2013854 RepID=A0A2N1PU29_9BACT|nr:MAG: hypothetical protein CVV64_00025 [Candidatus Wallbacteria bacterium HGW-Wallbacteria-1]
MSPEIDPILNNKIQIPGSPELPAVTCARISLILILSGMIRENPVFTLNLGLCSVIAATGSITDSAVMSLCVITVMIVSSALVSIMKSFMTNSNRLILTLGILGTTVCCSTQAIHAFWPETHMRIGSYLSLVVTNCVILGRLEGFARFNNPIFSMMDSFGHALGYGFVIMGVAGLRYLSMSALGSDMSNLGSLPVWAFMAAGLFLAIIKFLTSLYREKR